MRQYTSNYSPTPYLSRSYSQISENFDPYPPSAHLQSKNFSVEKNMNNSSHIQNYKYSLCGLDAEALMAPVLLKAMNFLNENRRREDLSSM